MAGPFNYRHIGDSALFLDATLKWRPWHTTISIGSATHTLGLVLGDTMGIGIHDNATGNIRNFIYAAGYLMSDTTQTRISTGVYHATRNIFDAHDRVGAQLTFEQPISLIPGLTLAADWYSGNGDSLTLGFLWDKNNFNVSIGYSLSNNGRKNDLIILSTAFRF